MVKTFKGVKKIAAVIFTVHLFQKMKMLDHQQCFKFCAKVYFEIFKFNPSMLKHGLCAM